MARENSRTKRNLCQSTPITTQQCSDTKNCIGWASFKNQWGECIRLSWEVSYYIVFPSQEGNVALTQSLQTFIFSPTGIMMSLHSTEVMLRPGPMTAFIDQAALQDFSKTLVSCWPLTYPSQNNKQSTFVCLHTHSNQGGKKSNLLLYGQVAVLFFPSFLINYCMWSSL